MFAETIISDKDKWYLVKSVVKVERMRQVFNTKKKKWENSDEVSFYVSTCVLSAEDFCRAIRNHWGIENRNHNVRDVSLEEDQSRIRTNPHIIAKIRSFSLNIMRVNQITNIKLELFKNCMNINRILNYEGIWQN